MDVTVTPSTRDRLLTAFEDILIEDGERAATLEAVAAKAGVSKGGLLYHFTSKEALAAGLTDRLLTMIATDVDEMKAAPEGIVSYFIRTSVSTNSELDRTIIAAAHLAQGSHPKVKEALQKMQSIWLDVIRTEVSDPTVARVIMLLSDGLYYNSALLPAVGSIVPSESDMDDLISLVTSLTERRAAK